VDEDDGVWGRSGWVEDHQAEITVLVVGAVVGIGCGIAIGWTGVGAVASERWPA
jgi:hypothetical protein